MNQNFKPTIYDINSKSINPKLQFPPEADCKCSTKACSLCCNLWDISKTRTSLSMRPLMCPTHFIAHVIQPDEQQFDCNFQHLKRVIKEKESLIDTILNTKNDSEFELSPEAEALNEAISKANGKDLAERKANVLLIQEHEFQKEVEILRKDGITLFDMVSAIGSWEIVKDILLLNRTDINLAKELPKESLFLNTDHLLSQAEQEKNLTEIIEKNGCDQCLSLAKTSNLTEVPSNQTCLHVSPKQVQVFYDFQETVPLDPQKILKKLFNIKDAYKRDFMIYLIKYRKWYVDNVLAQINKKYNNLLLMDLGSGSRDPVSDYDIVISTKDQSIVDVLAAKDFNQFFSKYWGRPSGVVFDTNLYVKDFASLEEKLDKDIVGTPFQDRPAPSPEDYFIEADMIKQQQIALVKQRVHMSQYEWDEYVGRLVGRFVKNKDKQNIKRIYDNANRCYFKSVLELLYQINGNDMPKIKIDFEENQSCEIEVTGSEYKTYTKKELVQMEDEFKNSKERMPVKVTEAYNQIYLERKALIRQLTNEHRNIKERFKSREYMPSTVKKRLETLGVKIKVLIANSCIFGNEMYFSEGAVKHVGIEQKENKADPEIEKRRDLRLNNLSNNDILASINEQLGDFLKDIAYYAQKNPNDPSEAFYRSSKYLLRLFKGVQELTSKKMNRLQISKKDNPKINGLTASLLRVEVSKILYQIRKGSEGKWAVASNSLKAKVTLEEAVRIFGTIDLDQFVEIIKDYVSNINFIAYIKSNVWKIHEHLGNLSYHMKFRKERPKKFCICSSYDKKGYQNAKQAIYKQEKHIHIKRLDLDLFTNTIMTKNHMFIQPCNQTKYVILAILTTLMNFLMHLIPGILKNLCPPLMLLYLGIVSKMRNAKPSDRIALDFHASIRTINHPTFNIHEESNGEIENLRVAIGQIYNVGPKIARLIAFLRILSLFCLLCMPWLSWVANMINLTRYVFHLFNIIPVTVPSAFKIFSFVNSTTKTIIDLSLWISLIYRRKEVKGSTPKTNQEYQGIRREFKKYRANSLADIVVLIFSICVGTVMLSISSDNSPLLGLVPGLSGLYINQDLPIQNPEFTVRDHLIGWVLPFIFSIVGNTIIELLATKMKGSLVMSYNNNSIITSIKTTKK